MSDLEQPLADRIRPETLDDVVGQKHLLGPGGLLRRFIDSGSNANMIFYGPSGVGKTTVANIIAKRTSRPLYRLNATTASTQDIRDIMGDIGTLVAPNGVLLYLDEIQYFNKRQQQSLLEFMENGKITLIASTTENPYFCVFNALLSRSTVFEFKALSAADVLPAIQRGFRIVGEESKLPLSVEEGVDTYIASACGGDVRKGLNAVEFLYETAQAADGRLTITLADAQQVTQRSAMRYDREGDNHYDLLSALQKSIRGSDPDAAVHYLAKLLVAGDLLSPCRRLLVTWPGLPEALLPLSEAAILLATAPKSNPGHNAIIAAMEDVEKGRTGDVPRHLQNVHADSTGSGPHETYKYPHVFPNRWVEQQYLPDAVKNAKYYEYGDNKTEQAAKAYWERIKGKG